jgi:uncharacterized protein YeaO (DUF488 family)
MLKIKRIYDPPSEGDGRRILVDRLWPRGVKKEEARIDEWLKEISPSNELRKWFGHDPAKWPEFKKRYRKELEDKKAVLDRIKEDAQKKTVTLLYAAHDEAHNNAAAMKEFLSGTSKG